MLDRFDDHDGVVHHDTDGKHKPEERDRIEGKSKQRHGSKGADERDNHSGEGDDRRAPTLEEKKNDQRHQQNRLEKSVPYGADRLLDKDRRVIDDLVIHTRWEVLL